MPEDHLVHFFETDEGLVEAVTGYLAAGLLDGAGAVVIATADHRDQFRRALGDAGVDIEHVAETGQLQLLDAAETLGRISAGGHLDPLAFRAVVGGLVRSIATGERSVLAYGEMVALLWADGDVAGAMELEQLWNDLRAERPFTLLCAYPSHLFEDPISADGFGDVCSLHSHVVSGAPDPGPSEIVRRFPRTPHAARLARQFVRDTLESWSVPGDAVDDALLVTSELVTNAMLHAGSDIAVGLARQVGGVRITVGDTSVTSPAVRELAPQTLDGRGLAMVRALATEWGHHAVDGGKLVWADLNEVVG